MTANNFGRYEIKSELGRGGMATVYLAYDPRFGRQVALKVMAHAFRDDHTFRGRFEREARTIASLEHPSIVPVYDFGEDNDQLYLVMRYMPGSSLTDRIIQNPLSIEEALPIIRRIGDALDHAHSQGVIHRDLKPGNILFDQYGNPFLSDFGIVKLAEATSNATGSGVIGTPAYMSPEQVDAERAIDGRSDIYTLGIILFEMLTGRKPYRADTPAKLMMAHLLQPVPSILALKPGLPPDCESVVQKALAKEPAERFATAGELTAALTRAATGRNIPRFPLKPAAHEPLPATAADDEATATASANMATDSPAVKPPAEPWSVVAGTASEATAPASIRREGETTDRPASPAPGQRRLRSRWPWLAGLFLALALLGSVFAMLSNADNNEPTPTITPDEEVAVVATLEPTATPTAAPTFMAPPPTPTTPTETPAPLDTRPITETYQLGRSVLGKPIEAVRFGKGPNQIVFVGGLHAGFAPATVALAQRSIEYFNQNLQEIPNSAALYIIPLANPDSMLMPGDLLGRVNGHGVDLNRNWDCRWQQDTHWREGIVEGLGGPAPFSEPETRSLSDFILEQEATAVVFWEARAAEGLVSPGRCEEQSSISQPLAEAYGVAAGYPIANFEELVNQVVNGDGTNWLDEQGIPAIAVLLPNYDDVDWEKNLAGMLAVLQEFGGEAVPDSRDNR